VNGENGFGGFPGVAKATAIPNVFFATVLPSLRAPGDLLAFLWVARIVQEQRGEAVFATADQVWAQYGAAESFETLGGGRAGLERGLAACTEAGALLALRLTGPGGEETVYFVNNPASRRSVARARAGELRLKPETVAMPIPVEARPGIFRLYEEHVGTITPLVGERLLEAAEMYPPEWIEDAFREAAEMNARNWRYVDRILKNWSQEGRTRERTEGDSFEDRKQRYLGGSLGHVARYR
jgi:DnaD/phage-associated family protein